MQRTRWHAWISCFASLMLIAAAAACSSGDVAPAKTGSLTDEEIQQVKELDEQRQSEWGPAQ